MKRRSVATIGVVLVLCLGAWTDGGSGQTRTPIKHLIVVVGENRSFDNVFGTYVSLDPTQSVWNLLSLGIVDRAGRPGPNFPMARQMRATNTESYAIAPTQTGAFPYLPQPSTTLGAYPLARCPLSELYTQLGMNPAKFSWCSDIGLLPYAQTLLSKGGSGQTFFAPPAFLPEPDCRYPSNLPNGPYSIVGTSVLNNCPAPTFSPLSHLPASPTTSAIRPTDFF